MVAGGTQTKTHKYIMQKIIQRENITNAKKKKEKITITHKSNLSHTYYHSKSLKDLFIKISSKTNQQKLKLCYKVH